MINSLIGKQSHFIESFSKELFLAPINIPVIIFGLLIRSLGQGCRDAICEECLEFYIGAIVMYYLPVSWKVILLYIFSKVLRHAIILI